MQTKRKILPLLIRPELSIYAVDQTLYFSACYRVLEDYSDHEGKISPHQNPEDPIGEAFSESQSI